MSAGEDNARDIREVLGLDEMPRGRTLALIRKGQLVGLVTMHTLGEFVANQAALTGRVSESRG